MPEVNAPQQQAAMEMQPTSPSGVVTQQPAPEGQMDTQEPMSLRGGCTETCGCCGEYETCTLCCG